MQSYKKICKYAKKIVTLCVFLTKIYFLYMKNIVATLVLACLALVSLPAQAQKSSQESDAQDYVVRCVAFYNLENLFDTIHDYYLLNNGDTIHKNDYEYLPDGGNHWSGLKYRNKLKNMAYAISQFGLDKTPLGASIIGVCEVENIRCLQALADEERTMVIYESPYRLVKLLTELAATVGEERQVSVSREISKLHAETARGTLSEVLSHFQQKEVKGEIVVVLAGKPN